ncbi:Pkinase-domain-containing protein [Tilletiopsis washingtonensis]|uniref:Pkinase-domain-containing protein n=1 Tax=Tilletiopsis washingtonensis TaxID=58919 RepID=A0A316ZI89_9BASI|nr:Pkinase-domain-containing protein [Tilletiopsis washingtonensis]PWO01232.1 Pkinase-domain-containing protein [Tilletiopsis washingtonensis]
MSPATQPALSPAHAGAEQQAARSRNGSGHESWEHVAPQGKGSMGPPAVPASRSAAHTGAYSSGAYNASYALPHERAGAAQSSAYAAPHSAGAHPASKSATGGGSHGHRPVSAMPAPVRSHAPSAAMPHDAGVLASMNAGASYNERRASAHPTVSASHTTGAIAPPMPISPSGTGLDATTSNAISSGIPITSPAALSYFAAHPRRQQVHFGSYLLLQTLGEGEFGKVKLGVHKEWGEEVAVKLIKREKVGTPDGQLNINGPKDPAKMSKVEREIQVLKDVRHPNIVRLYEVIESDRYIGIVLEYASGGELFDHILAHKYLKERDACRLFAQLISGVSYLHQKKIVHRDLKLENLLLDRNRNVIITDFGFANNFEDKRDDLMATSCGSPCYAAPELVVQDGLYAGSAVDVWSCGVILYAMLAGYLPFDDDPANPDGDNINLLYKYIMATPLSFPEYISAEPRDLLSKMLVPDPLRRADLNGVMAHSWLAPYRDLFKFGVDELERAAIEQQSKKRQIYRQQMQVQQQLQEQQRQHAAAARRGTATPSDASTTKAQRHQSAMATTTASRSEVAYNAPTPTSARSRPVTGIPTPIAAEPPLPVAPTSMTLTPQMSAGLEDTSFGSIGHRSGAPSSAGRKREAVAQDTPSADGYAQKKAPSAQKTQRHTIQLEYDGNSRQEQQRSAPVSATPPLPRVEQRAVCGCQPDCLKPNALRSGPALGAERLRPHRLDWRCTEAGQQAAEPFCASDVCCARAHQLASPQGHVDGQPLLRPPAWLANHRSVVGTGAAAIRQRSCRRAAQGGGREGGQRQRRPPQDNESGRWPPRRAVARQPRAREGAAGQRREDDEGRAPPLHALAQGHAAAARDAGALRLDGQRAAADLAERHCLDQDAAHFVAHLVARQRRAGWPPARRTLRRPHQRQHVDRRPVEQRRQEGHGLVPQEEPVARHVRRAAAARSLRGTAIAGAQHCRVCQAGATAGTGRGERRATGRRDRGGGQHRAAQQQRRHGVGALVALHVGHAQSDERGDGRHGHHVHRRPLNFA